MRKVFGIGETILDIIFRNDQPQKAVPGGSVFNGLISLGRLNVPVSFISELGNDRVGDMIRDFMEDNHITTEFVDRFPDGKVLYHSLFWTTIRTLIISSTRITRRNGWRCPCLRSRKTIFSCLALIIP